MDNVQPTILLSAGGTGGHVFPARALADELILRGYQVEIATDTRGVKYFDGLDAKIPRHIISSGSYASGILGKVLGMFELLKGFIQSIQLIRRIQPIAIVGFGGYPSAPPVFAGQMLGIKTVIHESNAILGLANKLLAHFVSKIAISYPETVGITDKLKSKSICTGNPVRQAIADLSIVPYPSLNDKITIMVVGGSQGAKVFSDIVPLALCALPPEIQSRLNIIQQSIPSTIDAVRELYSKSKLDFEIKSFFDDMPIRFKNTHLFIARSGASTVAEMTAAGRPAIYVPFPWNRDNQQVFNAEQVAKSGGGWVVLEKDLTVEGLKTTLEDLLQSPENLKKAAESARKLGLIDATQRLADIIAEFD
jgi:UDP-N-acetylglucosamine--N-acetylmuramyl-(pentapeptide) pyrophosphoryl-undecaprenol N-acetylglucosamine transferase